MSRLDANQCVWDALEAAPARGKQDWGRPGRSEQQVRGEITVHRRSLLHFLEGLDADMTVQELREAIDGYEPGFGNA